MSRSSQPPPSARQPTPGTLIYLLSASKGSSLCPAMKVSLLHPPGELSSPSGPSSDISSSKQPDTLHPHHTPPFRFEE